jgi:endonuclease/exonuclease/phosphatase family metal-dependent hydrolase
MLRALRLASSLVLCLYGSLQSRDAGAVPEPSSVPASSSAPAQSAVPSVQKGRFELLTYNVAGLPEGISRSRPTTNLPLIAERLARYDIALVQEDFAYPELLRRGLGLGHRTPAFVRGERLDFGDGLSQFARLPFEGLRRVPWRSCNGIIDSYFDCLTPKGFTSARQTLADGVSVHVFNLHMDAGRSEADRAARAGQVEQLILALLSVPPSDSIIVAGDTNLWGQDSPLLERLLAATGLSDACATLKCSEPWRVDRVLYRGGTDLKLTPSSWRIAREFVDAQGQPLSDHPAVAVTFTWERKPLV